MSRNYDKYKAMSDEQLAKEVNDRKVSIEYLSWLGVTGKGALLRNIINQEKENQ